MKAAWIIGGVGLAGSVIGALLHPATFAFAWLAALSVWVRWPLGCLALMLVHTLTGGRWGLAIRPWLLLGIGGLPLLLPAIIPVLLLLPHLYPWAHANAHLANAFYLNLPFAAVRCVLYLIVWFVVTALALWRLRLATAAIGLILLGLTVNFAAIDMLMSLDPHFNSSDFGMTFAAESALLALSITMLGTVLSSPVAETDRDDLARLLQGLLILWAYLDFMQVLIVWQSDLAPEAAWYVVRWTGLWGAIAGLIAIAHFLLPFLALLLPRVRRSHRGIIAVTSLLIVLSVVRGWWLVLPAQGRGIGWIDIAAMLAFGGISLGFVLRGPTRRVGLSHA
ncbi:MAG TPA: hypothetical protein VGM42_12920 [Rhodopila sp.]